MTRLHARSRPPRAAALMLVAGLLACEKFDPPGGGRAQPGSTPQTPPEPSGDSSPPPMTGTQDAGIADTPASAGKNVAFLLGQSGRDTAFVPNPDNGTVAIIDARTFRVAHAPAGQHPSLLAAHPDHNLAVALDTWQQRAYVLDGASPDREASPTAVHAGANAIAIDGAARHALLYYDDAYAPADPGPNGSEALQPTAATLLTLDDEQPRARSFDLGQRPTRVEFTDAGDVAFVFGNRGVSRLLLTDLIAGRAVDTTPIDFDALVDADARTVAIASDADAALVATIDEATLVWLDLDDGKAEELVLTDLDAVQDAVRGVDQDAGLPDAFPVGALAVADDGRHALAWLPDQELLVSLDLPGALTKPNAARAFSLSASEHTSLHIAGDQVGVVLDNDPDDPRLTLLDLADGDAAPRTRPLPAPARPPIFTEGHAAFVLLHDDPSFMGYNLVVPPDAPQPRATRVAPAAVSLASASESLWTLVLDPEAARPHLEELRFGETTVRVRQLPGGARTLGPAPGAEKTIVYHEHADGRISTVAWETLDEQTLTGFQLVDRVRE